MLLRHARVYYALYYDGILDAGQVTALFDKHFRIQALSLVYILDYLLTMTNIRCSVEGLQGSLKN